MGITSHTAAPALALWLFFMPPVSDAIDTIANTVASFVHADIGNLSFISLAEGQPAALTTSQSDALNTYNNAVSQFKSILSQRRAQINSKQQLPNLPGQALYLARNNMISAYKDLTDALPSRIGRPNKFGIPPAYFDAGNEPLLEEYANLFKIMQAPPLDAQDSDTPFHDVVDLGAAIARAKGLDAANAEVAGRISLGLFFAETNGNQNMGNARSNKYKGSLQTGVSEDQNGQRKWSAIKKSIAAFDPALSARDDREEARVGNLDPRYNHWTAVRNALMNAHADVFPHIPALVKALPDPIDQMKLFELIQIVPSPTKAALKSGNLANYRISDPTIMGFLRNNSIFTFGQADRAKTSATFREILNAMWLFDDKFERALSKFNEIKARKKGEDHQLMGPRPPSRAQPSRFIRTCVGRCGCRRIVCSHRTAPCRQGLLGVKQPDVSKMLRGDFRQFSVERLMRFLVALGQDVEIVVTPRRDNQKTAQLRVA